MSLQNIYSVHSFSNMVAYLLSGILLLSDYFLHNSWYKVTV